MSPSSSPIPNVLAEGVGPAWPALYSQFGAVRRVRDVHGTLSIVLAMGWLVESSAHALRLQMFAAGADQPGTQLTYAIRPKPPRRCLPYGR
jgi:hypothetical protein